MAALNKPLQFDKICRACLEIKKDMRPLFEQLTATMLMGISKVQVAVGDGLPPQLCLQCVHQISRCHAFKDLVERNDVTLREHAARMAEEAFKREREEKDKLLSLNCAEPSYMQYMEVPLTNPAQILDGFFTATPDPLTAENTESKQEYEVEKLQPDIAQQKDKEGLNSDEENYLQLVLFQATSTGQGMLKMHMRTHEARPAKQPTCSVCQRTFPTKTLLYRHRQTHFEQKTHLCTVCDKRFYSAYALRSHMARHRGERPYVCSTCTKSFYNPTDLKAIHPSFLRSSSSSPSIYIHTHTLLYHPSS
ncbi:hypothetical protein B5X24_HaOG207586 [Helicoverpa armigera]|nr:hypothetical protein B5X24_HaOG207586 [Helicoverpa armigera]